MRLNFRNPSKKLAQFNRKNALALYRKCIKTICTLVPEHQKTWYDYLRLNFESDRNLTDQVVIRSKIAEAYEQLEWVDSIVTLAAKKP